jgi:hypothetical protein
MELSANPNQIQKMTGESQETGTEWEQPDPPLTLEQQRQINGFIYPLDRLTYFKKRPEKLIRLRVYFGTAQGRKDLPNLYTGMLNAIAEFYTELAFLMVPVIVLTMVRIYKGDGLNITSFPEWSFIAVVLFGQAIIRMFHVLAGANRAFNPITTSATVASMIVGCLIPSVVILILVLVTKSPSYWLLFCQCIMFELSVATLLLFVFLKHTASEVAEIIEVVWPGCIEPKIKPDEKAARPA